MKLTGIASLGIKNRSASSYGVEGYVVHLKPEKIIFSEAQEDFTLKKIQQKIDVFASQIGYESDLTPVQVYEAITAAANAFVMMRSYRRRGNVRNLRDRFGFEVGRVLSDAFEAPATLIDLDFLNPQFGTGIKPYVGMSNSDWSDLVGQLAENFYVPKGYVEYLAYLTDNVFLNHINNDDGVSQVFTCDMYSDKTELISRLDVLSQKINSNPLLRTFMEYHMNINPIEFFNTLDWTRDLSGTTVSYVNDVKFIEMLETTANVVWWRAGGTGTPLADFEFFYTPDGVMYDSLTAEAVQNFSVTENLHKIMASVQNDVLPPKDLPMVMDARVRTGGFSTWIVPTVRIDNTVGFSSVAAGDLETVFRTLTIGLDKFPLDEPIERFVNLRAAGGKVTVTDTDTPTNRIKGGYNVFGVDEDTFLTAAEDVKLSLLFGQNYQLSTPVNYNTGEGQLKPQGQQTQLETKAKGSNRGRNNNRNRNKPKNDK